MSDSNKARSWIPSPSDKYLPIWVILIMFFSVLLLSLQMTSTIKDVCSIKNRCYDAVAVRDNSNVAEVVGDAVKKAAETQVANHIAEAASAAASATKQK